MSIRQRSVFAAAAILGACSTSEEADSGLTASHSRAEVCAMWELSRDHLSEGSWSGSVAECDPGELSQEGVRNALMQVNYYRWLSGLPMVSTSEELNASAQDCALLMHASGTLTHYPDASYPCYTERGAASAGSSNIATCAGVCAVDLYMGDYGNASTLGHRRWILSNGLGPIGLGSTDRFSCMEVIGGTGEDQRSWTAFPPAGPVPLEMWWAGGFSLDETGWSVQSDTLDLGAAELTVTRDDGAVLPMTLRVLSAYYGSSSAISMIPDGWEAEADRSYTLRLTGLAEELEYTVEPVRCED